MRKKSHISLARYIVDTLGDENLKKHKFSFYLGSILPDIKPSFIYKRHEMEATYPDISRHIKRLSEGQKLIEQEKAGIKYYMDLGQISHYLADYFTFPHNKTYQGSLKDHCSYEQKLKEDLREYLLSRNADKLVNALPEFDSAESLCEYIKRSHDEYLAKKHNVESDIFHIIKINQMAMNAMLLLLAMNRLEYQLQFA